MDHLNEASLYRLVNHLSQTHFNKPFVHVVRFNSRLRTTGGRYIPAINTIEINPKYALEMDHEELVGIIKHELCHYHLHIEGKGYKHRDRDFKDLLKATGSPRHCQPLPSLKEQSNYIYSCRSCGLTYKRKRRVNTSKYVCGKCRGRLVMREHV
ncbi:SprT family protein [Lentibacillus saliphilus]|uniref:SprT family protein n=1 Tax=Lentibacillus saliphilus TaxID=2737028 RepID=UPI001C305AE3|nr:SprT family protein [Lentibacillus saliphilus]